MALLTAQPIVVTGLAATYGAVSASDTVAADSGLFLHVKNAGGSSDTVTVVVPGTTYGQNNPDYTVSVPATTGERFIPLYPAIADPTTGLITILHSFTTSVTCAVIKP